MVVKGDPGWRKATLRGGRMVRCVDVELLVPATSGSLQWKDEPEVATEMGLQVMLLGGPLLFVALLLLS